eukprot:3591023-Pleurochrysis_carterae.AAC.1
MKAESGRRACALQPFPFPSSSPLSTLSAVHAVPRTACARGRRRGRRARWPRRSCAGPSGQRGCAQSISERAAVSHFAAARMASR